MAESIYLPTDLAQDKEVIRVNGVCYQRVGPSSMTPDTVDITEVFEDCETCEAEGSSSDSSESTSSTDDGSDSSTGTSGDSCCCWEYAGFSVDGSSGNNVEVTSAFSTPYDVCKDLKLRVRFTITNFENYAISASNATTIQPVPFPGLGEDFQYDPSDPADPTPVSISVDGTVSWNLAYAAGESRTFELTYSAMRPIVDVCVDVPPIELRVGVTGGHQGALNFIAADDNCQEE